MKNQPNKVYLQLGLEDNGETCDDFNELNEISWCADKIYEDDLEYVSITFLRELIKDEELINKIINEKSSY